MRPGGRPPGAVRSRRRADPAARSRVARLLRRSTGRIASAIRPTVFRGEGEPYPHPSPAALRVASLPRGTFTTACQGLWPHRRSSVARVRTPSSRRRRAASAGGVEVASSGVGRNGVAGGVVSLLVRSALPGQFRSLARTPVPRQSAVVHHRGGAFRPVRWTGFKAPPRLGADAGVAGQAPLRACRRRG